MRRRDLLPLALLVGIAAFVGTQVVRRPRLVPAPRSAADARLQGTPVAGTAARSQAVGVTDVAASAEPRRDDAALRLQLRDGAAGTYIQAIIEQQDGWLIRWPDRQLQGLRVWIQGRADIPNFHPSYPVVAERAFAEWRNAGFPIRFDMVPDSAGSEIRIRWTAQFPPANGRRIGVTHKVRDRFGWLVDAEVVVATHDSTGAPLAPALIAGVARHEVGHALGLGHSGSPSDVMYPESRTEVISAADRATLHLLYRLPPGVVPEIRD